MSRRAQSVLSGADLAIADDVVEWTVLQAKKYNHFRGDRHCAAAVYERHARRCASTTPYRRVDDTSLGPLSILAPPEDGAEVQEGHGDMSIAVSATPSRLNRSLVARRQQGSLAPKDRDELRQKLEPKTILDAAFEAKFSSRLRDVNRHNTKEAIEHAMSAHEKLQQEQFDRHQQLVEDYEERRLRADDVHRHAGEMRRHAELLSRMKLWGEVLAATTVGVNLLHEVRKRRALTILRRGFLPMILIRLRMFAVRRHRREVTEARLALNPHPTGSMLASIKGPLFEGWSTVELQSVAALCKPISFLEGETIMQEGDFDRVMYVVTRGDLKVMIRDRSSGCKKRTASNSSAVVSLQAPAYIGEYALLCKEPRSATIQCVTDVDAWTISSDAFANVLRSLNPEVAERLEEATDERRRTNLQKFFAYKMEYVRRCPVFETWAPSTLKELIRELQPVVVRRGFKLFSEGEYDPSLYFVSEGTIKMWKPSEPHEPPARAEKHACLGAFETFFMYERRSYSAYCETPCDLWKLSRHSLLNLGMGDPAALIQSRTTLQRERAALISKPAKAPQFVVSDAFLQFVLPPAYIQMLWNTGQARVYCTGEVLCEEGEDARHVFVVILGSFTMTHQMRDHQKYDERVIVSPVLHGSYSSQTGTNQILATLFPSASLAEIPRHAQAQLQRPRRSVISSTLNPDQAAKETNVGIVLGGYELASRRARYVQTIRCQSMCEVVVLDRDLLEEKLPDGLKKLLTGTNTFSKYISDCYLKGEVKKLLLPESANFKVATIFANMRQQEKKETNGGGSGDAEGGGVAVRLPAIGKGAR